MPYRSRMKENSWRDGWLQYEEQETIPALPGLFTVFGKVVEDGKEDGKRRRGQTTRWPTSARCERVGSVANDRKKWRALVIQCFSGNMRTSKSRTLVVFCVLLDDGLWLPLSSGQNDSATHCSRRQYAEVSSGLLWSSQPANTWPRPALGQTNVSWTAWSTVHAAHVVWIAASSRWRGLSDLTYFTSDYCHYNY